MNEPKILFATDFSHAGDAAMELAASIARDRGAKLLILHVEEPPRNYGGEMYYGALEPDLEEIEQMLQAIKPTVPDVLLEYRLVQGDPAETICQVAKDERAEMIVLGTHGRTGLLRMLMGSVAEAVVRHAPCPVLTLRQPHRTAAAVT